MNVLRVTASMDPAMGGPPQGIRNSIAELERLGISNEAVCCDAPDAAWLGKDSFPVHALGPGEYGFAYTPKLGTWLEENLPRFDAVIVHGLWLWPSLCATRAVRALRRRAETGGLRSEVSETADGGDAAATVLRDSKQLRCFVMPHGMLDPWFQRDRSRRVKAVRNWFYWWLVERNVVNWADALLFTCEQELELARTTFGGYRPKREINVGYGIAEPPAFEPKMQEAFAARCPDLNGRPYLLFMSRVHPKKGVDLLVRAYARVRSEHEEKTFSHGLTRINEDRSERLAADRTEGESLVPATPAVGSASELSHGKALSFPDLVVAGPGWDSNYGREVRGLIDEANRSIALTEHRADAWGDGPQATLNTANSAPIHSVDMLSGAAKWGALYGCEAFVLLSHQENFGIAVVEALACGKPVLISDQVNIWREIVEDGAGMVEADTEEGVEKLLRKFLSTQKDEVGSASAQSDYGVTRGGPRECYLKRFAIGPAAAKLAETLSAES
jgi:glycosyltransferase involved in cell wall biosynthesis